MPDSASGTYPFGWDVEWVAVDRHGRVGAFTTGGRGPIPRAYLATPNAMDAIRDALWALPERTESILFAQLPRPDDYEAFARRGCFAFDWVEGGQPAGPDGVYELQARPSTACTFDEAEWPAALHEVLAQLTSPALDFDQMRVDVSALGCEGGS